MICAKFFVHFFRIKSIFRAKKPETSMKEVLLQPNDKPGSVAQKVRSVIYLRVASPLHCTPCRTRQEASYRSTLRLGRAALKRRFT